MDKEIIAKFLDMLPEHKCSFYLEHNPHKSSYQTVERMLEDYNDVPDYYNFENEGSKLRSLETNEIWFMQWYRDTPVGFYSAAAPTLEELMLFVAKFGE